MDIYEDYWSDRPGVPVLGRPGGCGATVVSAAAAGLPLGLAGLGALALRHRAARGRG